MTPGKRASQRLAAAFAPEWLCCLACVLRLVLCLLTCLICLWLLMLACWPSVCPHTPPWLPARSSAVHSVLASLPKMTPQALDQFRQSLRTTGSEKVQRDLTKKMLVRVPGGWWVGGWALG
jgi:hypothetical protein